MIYPSPFSSPFTLLHFTSFLFHLPESTRGGSPLINPLPGSACFYSGKVRRQSEDSSVAVCLCRGMVSPCLMKMMMMMMVMIMTMMLMLMMVMMPMPRAGESFLLPYT